MEVFLRIKRLVLQDRMRLTGKALYEMELDEIEPIEVAAAIIGARRIDKTLRSRSPHRIRASEKLYVIKGISYNRSPIYTKGRFGKEGEEIVYVLISAKIDTR